MIAGESVGATTLGEVWYSEADRPEGPWREAVKIITHANKPHDAHDFYNPVQHPFLDRDGGRVIYLEGSYVNTFSGNPHPTPYYEYNQIMYRLDLIYLGSQGRIVEVACWAHARRKFFDSRTADQARAGIALAYIARLYAIEKERKRPVQPVLPIVLA